MSDPEFTIVSRKPVGYVAGPKQPELVGPNGVEQLAPEEDAGFEIVSRKPAPAQPSSSWRDTAVDGAIGLGEGVSRGLGLNPVLVANTLGGDRAGSTVRQTLADAHARSPIAAGIGSGAGQMVPGLTAAALTGGTVNPITLGALTGGLSGLGNSDAPTLSGMARDAGGGALMGAIFGAGARTLGALAPDAADVSRRVGLGLADVAESPMTRRAGQWAGAALGGSSGSAAGSALGPAGTAVGGFLGTAAGQQMGGRVGPAAIRGLGNAAWAGGDAIEALGASGLAQNAGTVAAATRFGQDPSALTGKAPDPDAAAREAWASMPPEEKMSRATADGRGNLLPQAALDLLRNNPAALGEYADQFAAAAASPETGAVSTLVQRLYNRDPKFRSTALVEMQRLTAAE